MDTNKANFEDIQKHSEHYSEEGFWQKITSYAVAIGRGLVEQALTLFYVLTDEDTPLWAKTTIVGALGYLISPLDLIPDMIPVFGYTDDAGVMALAISLVAVHIKEEHTKKAKAYCDMLFGPADGKAVIKKD